MDSLAGLSIYTYIIIGARVYILSHNVYTEKLIKVHGVLLARIVSLQYMILEI